MWKVWPADGAADLVDGFKGWKLTQNAVFFGSGFTKDVTRWVLGSIIALKSNHPPSCLVISNNSTSAVRMEVCVHRNQRFFFLKTWSLSLLKPVFAHDRRTSPVFIHGLDPRSWFGNLICFYCEILLVFGGNVAEQLTIMKDPSSSVKHFPNQWLDFLP